MTWVTVRDCLIQLFTLFGIPNYFHTDRGRTFLSEQLKEFLHGHGIVTSNTTPYNPRGNGQVERYNGTLWKAISLKLEENNLDTKHWER